MFVGSNNFCFVLGYNSVDDCPDGMPPAGDRRLLNGPFFKNGMCFYFLEIVSSGHSSSPTSLGENGCESVVPGSVMPCVSDEAFNTILESLLDDCITNKQKCGYDGFAIANGYDSKCTASYEPAGTSRDSNMCTSMDKHKQWINRCDKYVSSLCVLRGNKIISFHLFYLFQIP